MAKIKKRMAQGQLENCMTQNKKSSRKIKIKRPRMTDKAKNMRKIQVIKNEQF